LISEMNRILILLVSTMIFWACEQNNTVTVTGQIDTDDQLVKLKVKGKEVQGYVDQQGRFSLAFKMKDGCPARLKVGDKVFPLYLRPGDELEVKTNGDEVSYTGSAEKINVFLNSDSGERSESVSYDLDENEFAKELNNSVNSKAQFIKNAGISDERFISYMSQNQRWKNLIQLSDYERNHRKTAGKDYHVSDDFYQFEDTVNLNDTSQMCYPDFERYVDHLMHKLAYQRYLEREDSTLNYYHIYVQTLQDELKLDALKEQFLYELLDYSFTMLNRDQQKEYLELWKSLHPDTDKREKLLTKLNDVQRLERGREAPDFTYQDINGKQVSLSDFHGKYVFVDVWATWCGPCLKEQPFLRQMEERFHSDSLVFVSIGTDPDPTPWRKMIAKKKLGGTHLFAPGAWESQLMTDYAISSIPRFILIDPDGKFIDSDAPRPSEGVGDMIRSLLSGGEYAVD